MTTPPTPSESTAAQTAARMALARLRKGNARFAAERPKAPRRCEARRFDVAPRQNPFAVLLCCADSRVAPELVFDQGFGDLLVARNAGNVVGVDVSGTVEFGVLHLGARLVVVMGHEECGAVVAALDDGATRAGQPENLQRLLSNIDPALKAATDASEAPSGSPDAPDGRNHAAPISLSAAVEANVRHSVAQLRDVVLNLRRSHGDAQRSSPGIDDEILVVGAVYELATSQVRFLDDEDPLSPSAAAIGSCHSD